MKLSTFKSHLLTLEHLNFVLPNETAIPKHFHITEVGLITKHFIDCGTEMRVTKVANLQIWVAKDVDHRLTPINLLHILENSKSVMGDEDLEMEIEYQTTTIGKYSLDIKGESFRLIATQTNCLAADHCGISTPKKNLAMKDLGKSKKACCTPECCQ